MIFETDRMGPWNWGDHTCYTSCSSTKVGLTRTGTETQRGGRYKCGARTGSWPPYGGHVGRRVPHLLEVSGKKVEPY